MWLKLLGGFSFKVWSSISDYLVVFCWKTCYLSADQKAVVVATTNRDVSFSSVQVALQNSFADSHGSGAVSSVTDTRHGAGSPS